MVRCVVGLLSGDAVCFRVGMDANVAHVRLGSVRRGGSRTAPTCWPSWTMSAVGFRTARETVSASYRSQDLAGGRSRRGASWGAEGAPGARRLRSHRPRKEGPMIPDPFPPHAAGTERL